MSRLRLKIALVVLALGVVLYCLPSILPGENDVITAAEDADVSSDLLTITTYTGYQEAHLITFPDGATMSIDCGYKYGNAETITTISHFHEDHCGGCGAGQYNRNNVVPGDVIYSDEDRDITVTVVAANGAVIGQEPAGYIPCPGYENPLSMALLIKYKRFDYLTGGDLTAGEELAMGAALKERGVNVDVFKVSHHGSRTSTDINFLLDILPEYAVIAGGGSAPTEETISNLVFAGVRRIYYTDSYPVYPGYPICWALNGRLVITTDGDTYSISSSSCDTGPVDVDKTPTPTPTPTETPTWDPSVPTYTPTATPTLRPEGPWPMFRYDTAGTGQSRYFIGPQKGQLAWSYTTSWYVDPHLVVGFNPVVGFDGRVYVGSNDNRLYAFTSAGLLIWNYLTGGDVRSAAALDSDGVVHVGSSDDNFYAISSAGAVLWSYGTGGGIRSSAVIDSAGRIYVGSDDNVVYTFSSDGRLEWSYETGDNASSSPAVGSDGNIYTGSEDNVFYALGSDGSFVWSYLPGDMVVSSPVIKPDGSIYVGARNGFLYAFSSTGSFLWRYLTAKYADVDSSPVIDRSGNIYVGSNCGHFYGLTPSGKCRWSYLTTSVHSSAAIDSGGNIYIGAFVDRLFALTSTGCFIWSYRTGDVVASSPAIGCDGYVYVVSNDAKLYAFKDPPTPTPTPTETPTPTGTPTVTPTPTTTPTATIPSLTVLPGPLAVGRNFSVSLVLTEDITQPFDFYLFADTPVGVYTLCLDGKVKKGITPLYRNVKCFTKDYTTTVRPKVKVPVSMEGKTVTFYAAFVQAGKKPSVSRVSDLTPSTPYIIMMEKTSATINS